MNKNRIVLAVLLTATLAASPAFGQSLPSSHPQNQATSTAVTAESQPAGESDDWAPGLGLFALAMLIVMLLVIALMVGIGVVIGLFVLGLIAFMVVVGIVSSSAAVGLATGSPGKALKVLLIQLGALAGAACGIAVAWLLNHVLRMGFAHNWVVVAGVVGLATGAGVALASGYVGGTVMKRIVRKFKA